MMGLEFGSYKASDVLCHVEVLFICASYFLIALDLVLPSSRLHSVLMFNGVLCLA